MGTLGSECLRPCWRCNFLVVLCHLLCAVARFAPGALRRAFAAPRWGLSWLRCAFRACTDFFGRDLYKSLDGKVPIGLVASDWGGQRVECFSSPEALADTTCGGLHPSKRVQAPTFAWSSPPSAPSEADATNAAALDAALAEEFNYKSADEPNPGPGQLWNAMIFPLLRMRFTGAVWYQGEAKCAAPARTCRSIRRLGCMSLRSRKEPSPCVSAPRPAILCFVAALRF